MQQLENRTVQPVQLTSILLSLLILTVAYACKSDTDEQPSERSEIELLLPDGFEATLVVDSLGRARHMTINENGDIYVKMRTGDQGIVALRDTNGDGRADVIERFGDSPYQGFETGIELYDGYLYFSNARGVYRYQLEPGELVPQSELEIILHADIDAIVEKYDHLTGYEHSNRAIDFDDEGNMYIPFGSPGDNCQEVNREPGSPGLDPCPHLAETGGIWVFDAHTPDQRQEDGQRYATGIRSVTAQTWNPVDKTLYVVQHGRDYLVRMWPEHYTPWDSAMLPSEEFMRVTEGSDFGWPYCYHDQLQDVKVLNPEYGGDGNTVGRCSEFEDPLIGFPGHFAPNDLIFYHADQFPEYYSGGAFIAFHGSTTREGYPQAGYTVTFVSFEDGEPVVEWDVFANGFAGYDPLVNQGDALARPMGLAVGPDGSLYIIESVQGRIWRVTYTGDRESFGPEDLAGMEEVKRTASNIRTPDPEKDYLVDEDDVPLGEGVYRTYCGPCHGGAGQGSPPRFPPLAGTDWVTGDKQRLIYVILNGLDGPIEVLGETYNFPMPPHDFLSDEEVAAVATYIRQSFGNDASEVTVEEVFEVREQFE